MLIRTIRKGFSHSNANSNAKIEAFERDSKYSNAKSKHSNKIRPISCKFEPFERNSNHSNANSNHSNEI